MPIKNDFKEAIDLSINSLSSAIDSINAAKISDRKTFNIAVIYSNKIVELSRFFEEYNIDFFSNNTVTTILYEFLTHLNNLGIDKLDEYLRTKPRKRNPKDLEVYQEFCEAIYNLDLRDDFCDILSDYYHNFIQDDVFRLMYVTYYDTIYDEIVSTLRTIGLDDLVEKCISILDEVRCEAEKALKQGEHK